MQMFSHFYFLRKLLLKADLKYYVVFAAVHVTISKVSNGIYQ